MMPASITPAPIVPNPLISKDSEYFPDSDNPPHLQKRTPLCLYFEIYESQNETQGTAVYYRWQIINQKTGSMVMNTEPLSAADWVISGNVLIPIGLMLETEKLSKKSSYKLEVQASDSTGRMSEWRAAKDSIFSRVYRLPSATCCDNLR